MLHFGPGTWYCCTWHLAYRTSTPDITQLSELGINHSIATVQLTADVCICNGLMKTGSGLFTDRVKPHGTSRVRSGRSAPPRVFFFAFDI